MVSPGLVCLTSTPGKLILHSNKQPHVIPRRLVWSCITGIFAGIFAGIHGTDHGSSKFLHMNHAGNPEMQSCFYKLPIALIHLRLACLPLTTNIHFSVISHSHQTHVHPGVSLRSVQQAAGKSRPISLGLFIGSFFFTFVRFYEKKTRS